MFDLCICISTVVASWFHVDNHVGSLVVVVVVVVEHMHRGMCRNFEFEVLVGSFGSCMGLKNKDRNQLC